MNLYITFIITTLGLPLISCNTSRNNTPSWERETFSAVTQFEDLQDFYLKLRSEQENRLIQQPSMDVVKRICEGIFNSPYFEMNGQDHLMPNNCKILRNVLQSYPSIFQHICRKCSFCHTLTGCNDCIDGYHYENPYKKRPLFPNDDKPIHFRFEKVFVCLTKKRGTDADDIREYFVSVEYDVNETAESNIPVYSRFIFTRNMEKKLIIHAIAEESTLPVDELEYSRQEYKYEWFYYQNKCRLKNHESSHEDPICQLKPANKLRLCATIFSSPPFQTLRFFPTMNRVRIGCERITVSFRDEQREIEARKEENKLVYQDWMIACVVSPAERVDLLKRYYVSRGLRSNHVFVYELVDSRVFVKFYMVNVGAVLVSDLVLRE